MNGLTLLVCGIAFLQWAFMNFYIWAAQEIVRRLFGRGYIVLELLAGISAAASIVIAPLWLLGLLPLADYLLNYFISAIVGGVMAIPITIYGRRWLKSRDRNF
ncbi:hypothetical protein ABHF54_07965 [Nitrosomonas europaea]|uniref:hypothetical protein n=1 Tax=Nitrosomonas europaea TaxID=915 RepID=UPI00326762FD